MLWNGNKQRGRVRSRPVCRRALRAVAESHAKRFRDRVDHVCERNRGQRQQPYTLLHAGARGSNGTTPQEWDSTAPCAIAK